MRVNCAEILANGERCKNSRRSGFSKWCHVHGPKHLQQRRKEVVNVTRRADQLDAQRKLF